MAVIQASFPGKTKDNTWVLGDSCHQQANAQVPVLVLTDLKGVILISSEATDNSSWVVSRARVNISRFWTASTAFIKCSINLTNPDDCLPPLTLVEPYRPAKNSQAKDGEIPEDLTKKLKPDGTQRRKFPLGPGDEICIYIGYKNYLGESITKEDLGTRLLRVYIGSIDTVIDSTSTNDGFSYSIECRDRMKYLMDSLSSFNSAESENLVSDIGKNGQIPRKDVIMAIAKRAVGDLRGTTGCNAANCGFYISEDDKKNTQDVSFSTGYDGFRNYEVQTEDSGITFLGGKTTDKLEDISFFPKFNIITGRMPFSNGSDLQMNYVVTERVAIEYIKYLALQEPVMTEVFCDHRTGDYWYCPRGVDTSGLNDPKRFYRTYFNRIAPEGISGLYEVRSDVDRTAVVANSNDGGLDLTVVAGREVLSAPEEVHACQKLILFREEQSTLSWRSNIIVTKSNAASGGEAMSIHLRVIPSRFEGRAFPCSYYTVVDPSINSSAELVGVALAYVRAKGKEVRAATAHMIGDPSLTPGEAIQILGGAPKNSIKVPDHKSMLDEAITDKTNFVQYYGHYQDLALDLANQVRNNSGTTPESVTLPNDYLSVVTSKDGTSANTITGSVTGFSNTQIMCDLPNLEEGGDNVPQNDQVKFKDDPETIWRVEGLIHRFNDGTPGYYTELGLITPF
jgi:hypothetical protein